MKKTRIKNKRRFTIAVIIFVLIIFVIVFGIIKLVGTVKAKAEAKSPNNNATSSAINEPDGDQKNNEENYPKAEGILILANKTHALGSDYWPDDLVTVDRYVQGVGNNDTHKLRKVAAEALNKMLDAAEAEGLEIRLRTGFRSYEYQTSLYKSYVEKNGKEAADTFSARPGYSEHQTGLCCDLGGKTENFALSYDFGKTDEGQWVAEHAHEFGFIIRYTDGKTIDGVKQPGEITGYVFEPWHVRYVGEENAAKIYEQGITLEEYLGLVDDAQYKD